MTIKRSIRNKIVSLNKQLRGPRAFVWRRRLKDTTVIGVTGSCGKTSATQFLYHILSQQGACYLGINYNLPETVIKNILRVSRSDRFYVQEVSGHEPGVISRSVRQFSPDISVVTTIGQDHYTNFRTLESVADEKFVLVEYMRNGGTAILNIDDPYVAAMADRTRSRVLTFGVSEGADVHASSISASWPNLLSLTVNYRGERVQIDTGLFGTLFVTSLLAAVAAALASGVTLSECGSALQNVKSFDKRHSLHHLPSGAWVVSDCYKAPYWGVPKILDMLSDVTAPRITLVFGSFSDMPGAISNKYRKIALEALKVAGRVVFVGKRAAHVRKIITPENAGRLFAIDSIQDAAKFIAADTLPDEVVLIKSNSREHLERIYYSQSMAWQCWKFPCNFMDDCLECGENGLNKG